MEGNYIVAKVVINDNLSITLVNVYGELANNCEEIGNENTPVIIGIYFNVTLNGPIDTKKHVCENNT